MNSSKKIPVLAVAAALVAAAILCWWIGRSREAQAARSAPPEPIVAATPPPPRPVVAAAPAPPAAPPAPALAPAQQARVEATQRMYLAHAPLRAPEVANPDSEANRRILQAMVMKTLRPAPASPPPTGASN